jgi:hypothetical protein
VLVGNVDVEELVEEDIIVLGIARRIVAMDVEAEVIEVVSTVVELNVVMGVLVETDNVVMICVILVVHNGGMEAEFVVEVVVVLAKLLDRVLLLMKDWVDTAV